ncbi:hypothetical protein D6D01_07213 [Aureobasidium pullulans]|uniref:Uncharacterized protein n=1 Tax=Aureobasidium pullulans TaxID=5580 RepID=A0A4S9KS30_AURPU|nr:hypothetical protein D6D01_07213 [Aureobasidium pullulans]
MVIKYLHTWEHTLLRHRCIFNGLEWCFNPDEYFKYREPDQLVFSDIVWQFSQYLDRFVHYHIIIVEHGTFKHIVGSHITHSQHVTKSRAFRECLVQLFHVDTILTTHWHITLYRRDRRNRGRVGGRCSALSGFGLGTA